jgi:hypothetical protein
LVSAVDPVSRIPAVPVVAVSHSPQVKFPKALNIQNFVMSAAKRHGVDPALALWIVGHESQFNVFDPVLSTLWALQRIKHGYVHEWTTWRSFNRHS